MTDLDLERGLRCLLDRLEQGSPYYQEALVLEYRLRENLAQRRRYGDSESCRAERAQIVDALNGLALAALRTSFNQLCRLGSLGDKEVKAFLLMEQAWCTFVRQRRPSEFRRWVEKGRIDQAIRLLSWACRNLGENEYKVATAMLQALTENKDATPTRLVPAGKTLASLGGPAKQSAAIA